jgi:hypothetical protein
MEKQTKGAWIVHHTSKLQGVTNAINDYEQINFAGKCGLLLSSLASSEVASLTTDRVNALAKAVGITVRLELPQILEELEAQKLISRGTSGIDVLGLSTAATLGHITSIFEESEPLGREQAVIALAEKTSELPCDSALAREYISDIYKIATPEAEEVLISAESISLIDFEEIGNTKKLLFNGNLFRREDARKIHAVRSSLSDVEASKVLELNDTLTKLGCISLDLAHTIMESNLFKKLHSIGLYDVNTVSNDRGSFCFVTKPSAFSKFSETIADDAFDLAKIFVTSLTYGMTQSSSGRGRITMIQRLMQKLINGEAVGPATAIGHDYKLLEMRGVIQVIPASKGMFNMKLLKKDVGKLALKVIMDGDVSTEALPLPSASVISYEGPEQTRSYQRKSQTPQLKSSVGDLLYQLRTGAM